MVTPYCSLSHPVKRTGRGHEFRSHLVPYELRAARRTPYAIHTTRTSQASINRYAPSHLCAYASTSKPQSLDYHATQSVGNPSASDLYPPEAGVFPNQSPYRICHPTPISTLAPASQAPSSAPRCWCPSSSWRCRISCPVLHLE